MLRHHFKLTRQMEFFPNPWRSGRQPIENVCKRGRIFQLNFEVDLTNRLYVTLKVDESDCKQPVEPVVIVPDFLLVPEEKLDLRHRRNV